MKRMLCWLLSLLCLFCAHAEKAESPAVCRALLVGCDVFLTHEDTSPSAALNVERMDRMLRTDARGYEKITRRDAGLADGAALQAALAGGQPAVIDCAIDIDEMVRPMVGGGSHITKFMVD